MAPRAQPAILAAMSPDLSSEPVQADPPVGLAAVGRFRTEAAGAEHGLVVLAMGRPYWLESRGEDGVTLLVEPDAAPAVSEQLAAYDRESVGWPPAPIPAGATRPAGFFTSLLWAALVIGGFRAQVQWPEWTSAGALDAAAVIDRGEWWRIASALFLHADVGHLVSNLLGGIFVFSAVCATFGWRRGWALIALGALAANAASAALHHPERYVSIGASTALFAGLGVLTGRALRNAARASGLGRWRALFRPLAAGVTVLALYGAGGQRVDVGAHLLGFGFGVFVAGIFHRRDE